MPKYFPLYTAEELRKKGIEVVPVEELKMTKERETKDEQEIGYLRKAQRACEHAMALAITVIKKKIFGEGQFSYGERTVLFIEFQCDKSKKF